MKKVIHIPNKYLLLIDDDAKTPVKDGGWCLEIHEEYESDKIRIPDEKNPENSWYLRELNMAYVEKSPEEFCFHRIFDGSVKAIIAHLPLNDYPTLEGVESLHDYYKATFATIPGFVSFEQAEALKSIGYDEPSIGYYTHNGRLSRYGSADTSVDFHLCKLKDIHNTYSLAPMISEVFNWFEKKGYVKFIEKPENDNYVFTIIAANRVHKIYSKYTFESQKLAEIVCLNKLIELLEEDYASKSKSITKKVAQPATLPDGSYSGLWSGHVISVIHNGEVYDIETKEGVRGFNISATVVIKDGAAISVTTK